MCADNANTNHKTEHKQCAELSKNVWDARLASTEISEAQFVLFVCTFFDCFVKIEKFIHEEWFCISVFTRLRSNESKSMCTRCVKRRIDGHNKSKINEIARFLRFFFVVVTFFLHSIRMTFTFRTQGFITLTEDRNINRIPFSVWFYSRFLLFRLSCFFVACRLLVCLLSYYFSFQYFFLFHSSFFTFGSSSSTCVSMYYVSLDVMYFTPSSMSFREQK